MINGFAPFIMAEFGLKRTPQLTAHSQPIRFVLGPDRMDLGGPVLGPSPIFDLGMCRCFRFQEPEAFFSALSFLGCKQHLEMMGTKLRGPVLRRQVIETRRQLRFVSLGEAF